MSRKSKIDNSENPNLQEVYKDKKGNRWYALKDIMTLSAQRGIAAATAERYIGMMISKKEFDLAMEAHEKAAKELDITTCFAIVADLKHRSKFICEANSILDLANVYYMLEDEDPNDYDEIWADRKRAIWDSDMDCRAFFLNMGLQLTNSFSNTSVEDLIKFMEETKVIGDRIYRYIKRPAKR